MAVTITLKVEYLNEQMIRAVFYISLADNGFSI